MDFCALLKLKTPLHGFVGGFFVLMAYQINRSNMPDLYQFSDGTIVEMRKISSIGALKSSGILAAYSFTVVCVGLSVTISLGQNQQSADQERDELIVAWVLLRPN